MIHFEELQNALKAKLEKAEKSEAQVRKAHEIMTKDYNSIVLQFKKIDEQYTALKRDNDDVVDKLHSMNKARYELETRISDVSDKNKNLSEI